MAAAGTAESSAEVTAQTLQARQGCAAVSRHCTPAKKPLFGPWLTMWQQAEQSVGQPQPWEV